MGFLFFLLMPFMSLSSNAAPACFDIFQSQIDEVGRLNTDFVRKHTANYDVDLTAKTAVKDQCAFGVCHLYAWSAHLESRSGIAISSEYLTAVFIYNSAIKALKGNDSGDQFQFSKSFGAFSLQSLAAVRRAGLIPKSAWQGKKDFNKEPMASRLAQSLEAVISNATLLKKQTSDEGDRQKIEAEAINQINYILGEMVGPKPSEFTYENKTYNPVTFSQAFFPELYDPVVTATVFDQAKNVRGNKSNGITQLTMNMENFENLARTALDNGITLQLDFLVKYQFIDNKTGIMTIGGFNYPPMAAIPISRTIRWLKGMWNSMHAVELVGYELDEKTGRVAKWKIRNSWGDATGDRGFYHMYADYFQNYALNLSFPDKGVVPLPTYDPLEKQLTLPFD